MPLVIEDITVYQLSEDEFKTLHANVKGVGKRKLEAQRKFENLVVQRGFQFHESYVYKNAREQVALICAKHGKVSVAPTSYIKALRNGCKKCGDEYTHKLQRQEGYRLFIKRINDTENVRLKEPHFKYENASTKVSLICAIHGEFITCSDKFNEARKKGNNGCKKCGNATSGRLKRATSEQELIQQVNDTPDVILHPEYKYIDARSPVTFICKKHGTFRASPDNFKRGTRCQSCWNARKGQHRKDTAKKEFETIIANLEGIEFSKDYVYSGYRRNAKLTCTVHGEFVVKPSNFLSTLSSGNNGCQLCGIARRNAESMKQGKLRFEEAVEAYPGITLHDDYIYLNNQTPTALNCNHHGLYYINPNSFLGRHSASGCRRCKEETHSWKILLLNSHQWNAPRDLYFNEFHHIDEGTFWKIGLAQPNKVRFNPFEMARQGLTLVREERITKTNYQACMTEYYVLTRYREHSKNMIHILNESSYLGGGTECFSKDLLIDKSLNDLINEAMSVENTLIDEVQHLAAHREVLVQINNKTAKQ